MLFFLQPILSLSKIMTIATRLQRREISGYASVITLRRLWYLVATNWRYARVTGRKLGNIGKKSQRRGEKPKFRMLPNQNFHRTTRISLKKSKRSKKIKVSNYLAAKQSKISDYIEIFVKNQPVKLCFHLCWSKYKWNILFRLNPFICWTC